MKISIIKGCWITNIGNAFIDFGSMESLRLACPKAEIVGASSFPIWIFHTQSQKGIFSRKHFSNYFSLIHQVDADFAVFSGMVLSKGFIQRYKKEILMLKKRGTRIIINGGGARTYSNEEVEKYRNFLKEVEPYCFISRDEYSFNYYKDLAEYSYNGIDCAFFINDYFRPAALYLTDFVVYTFDKMKVPLILNESASIVRAHHCPRSINKRYLKDPNTLISDRPEDYLNLYANAKITYTDRVHACVATLAFGNSCQLHCDTPRTRLFEKVGISTAEIRENVVSIDQGRLTAAKNAQVRFLSSVLKR